ncbi:MAG: hypothetical protein AAFQ94_09570 [Bacteroidota bacterium]
MSEKLRSSNPAIPFDISQWKSKEISIFQEDLLEQVNGRISEKWFYTHIKSEHKSLPRIDILDLLSQYVGKDNWLTYKEAIQKPKEESKGYVLYASVSIVILIIMIIVFVNSIDIGFHYSFCLVDTYSKVAITEQSIDIILLDKQQSPRLLRTSESGCINVYYDQPEIQFVVRSPYYSIDTVYRKYTEEKQEELIELKPNDYARIIHLFSNGNVSEWQSIKNDLEAMFHDNAKIYQLYEHSNNALTIYNKAEFISKLILPTGTLRNLEILDTVYDGDQISVLRFKKGNKNEK